jgi:hypothetical protein
MRSRIWAWIVTSSAVVGSSAIRMSGRQAEGDGDHHALAHAARELVRVLVERARARGSRRGAASRPHGRGLAPVQTRCGRIASSICQPIVKTGFRLVMGSWKIMAIGRRGRGAWLFARGALRGSARRRVDLARGLDAAVALGQEAHDRLAGDGLPAARLAHDSEGLARVDVEGDVIDRGDDAPVGAEPGGEPADREDRVGVLLCHVSSRAWGRTRPASRRRGC